MNMWRSLINRLSHAWVHYKTARVSLLTDQKISGRPIHVWYKYFMTNCEYTTDSSSSFLNWCDKNNPCFQRTNRHCQFDIFPHPSLNKTSWKYRSDNSPAKGWSYSFRSRGTTGSSILDHDFHHLCLGRRIHTSGHSDFGIFSNLGISFSIYRYCIRSLSFTIWEFCNHIHDFRRSHLWRRRFLLCEYSISVWVIFYNVITEFHTSFVLLKFLLQLSIFQVTHVHHWSKVDFSFVSLWLHDDLFLASDLSLIDWYFHSDLFFPVNDSFITDTDLDSCFLDLTEWENTLIVEVLSRSVGTKHRRHRASCWLAAAASGFLMRDLLWNTQWYSFLVIVYLIEDRRGIRLVIETDVGLIICVWDPVVQSDSPLSRATMGIRLDTKTNEEDGDVKHMDEKARSSIPRNDMTTRAKSDCFAHKTYDLSHAKCPREKCACCARLMGCAVHRNWGVSLGIQSLLWCFVVQRISSCLLVFLLLIWVWVHHSNIQIPRIQDGNSVHA